MNDTTHIWGDEGFFVQSRAGRELNFPVHDHAEMELTLILNARGAKRIIGNHIGEADDKELVLTGPHLPHGWIVDGCDGAEIREVTVLFQREIFPENLLAKNQLSNIRQLFEDAKRGIHFSGMVTEQVALRLSSMQERSGFEALHELYSILHQLSIARDSQVLSDITFTHDTCKYNSRRLERAFSYMYLNFENQISLDEVAGAANMPAASFSRFIKVHTGRTFTESLLEIRMGHVSRMLVETTRPVAEIAYACGFNNLANFNRTFKAWMGYTPREFKRNYIGGWSIGDFAAWPRAGN